MNNSSFKNYNVGYTVYFKCFSGSNTKQLNYYTNPALFDEQPNAVIVHVGSNNINKFTTAKLMLRVFHKEQLALGKNASHMVSIILQYRQFW